MRETKFTHAERRTRHGAEEILRSREEGNPRKKERKSKPRGRKSKNFSSANLDFPMGYRRFQIKKILGLSASLSASVRAPGHASYKRGSAPDHRSQDNTDFCLSKENVAGLARKDISY